MERKFYTDDFEQLLKEKSDEFRMYPSKRVWHSIYNDLHPGRKWPSIAVTMLLIIGLLMMGYWNSNTNDKASNSTIASITPAKDNTTGNNTIAAFTAADKNFNFIKPVDNINISKPVVANTTSSPVAAVKNILSPSVKTAGHTTTGKPVTNEEINGADVTVNKVADKNIILTQDGRTTVIITPPVIEETTETETAVIVTSAENDITGLTNDKVDKPGNSNDADNAVTTKAKTALSAEDKAWIEDYAFYNKSKRKPWKDRTTLDLYITPNVTFRQLNNDSKYNLPTPANSFAALTPGTDARSAVNQKPGLGLEAGLGITYAVGKNLRVKAGVQANYTNYVINADETNHPVLTTLMMVDPKTGVAYLSSNSSTLSNSSGLQSVTVHNKTYQFSVPVGMAYKIMGNDKLEFYAGAALQPTFVLGGKANLISADRKNYVAAPSLIRKWNLNTAFETYVHYKLDGFTIQAGPQFRYQLFSTYEKKYTVNENLYGMGIKVGILKNF